jgi:chitosanase
MEAVTSLIAAGAWELPLPLKVRGVTITDDNLMAPAVVVRATAADSDDPPAPPILYLTTPYQRGADVRLVQEALNSRSFANARDGVFGPFTEALVKMFQRAQGLIADGVVGPATRRALGL